MAALIGGFLLVCGAVWLLLRWIAAGPASPEPWDAEVAADLERDDCPQVCHRCFTPQDPADHFCPQCGAMVGPYTGLMPPLYLLSIGDVFTTGVEGSYRRSPWLIASYFLAGFVYLSSLFPIGILALPVYWARLLKHIPAHRSPVGDEEDPAPVHTQ